jgi:hypothetical protein
MRWLPFVFPATFLLFSFVAESFGSAMFALAACVLTFPPIWERKKREGQDTKPLARGFGAFVASIIALVITISAVGQLESSEPNASDDSIAKLAITADSEALKSSDEVTKVAEVKLAKLEPPRSSSSIYEQAIFDAFPSSPPTSKVTKRKASQASDFIGATINMQGHLCARPIEAQQASDGLYGVGCVTQRNGYGRSNYLINTRSGEVTKI